MALLNDPDSLNQGSEIVISTALKTITLQTSGNLSTDGVTLKAVYSFLKEEWKNDTNLIKFPFPMVPITDEQFELVNGWDFANTTTRNLIRTGGWALKDTNGISQEEYAGVISLGSIGGTDQVYYRQVATDGAPSGIVLTGPVNQAIKIYGDATHGSGDYRSYLKLFVREYQKSYASASLTDIGVTTMTYQTYRFPLANAADLKITHNDATVSGYGVTTTWYSSPQVRSIGGQNRNFHVIINGNNRTAEEIYESVQMKLRAASDIDAGSGVKTGKITDSLLQFVGDTLKTRYVTEGGVYIDNFQPGDTNRLVFVDDSGIERTYPYVATLTINFGENLVNDAAAIYRVFFTNDDAGLNTGRDFGTSTAITVNDNSALAMSGLVSGASSIQRTYDYDGNIQRGSGSIGTDAPITVVGIGLATGQYVKATGTIARSNANTVSLVAALERNYQNP